MSEETVEFAVLCSLFEAVIRSKKAVLKRKHIRTFLEHVYTDHEYFSAMRLILPDLDKERANYGLREAVLAKFLADALGLSKESEDAKKLLNWRKGGRKVGSNAGNFPFVAAEVLYSRQKSAPGGLKIKDVNDLLNRLAGAEDKDEKTAVLAELISKTNSLEMRWIIMIILKDLKLGISEKTVFSEFHPDAEDLFNVTCDLKLVCEKLQDRNVRYKRQDIEVGKAVRPQLAARVANVEEAWKKLRGKEVVVECKFDGDRIQVHKNGNNINFWSRTFNDHSEFKEAIADVLCDQIIPEKCILDGEMLVWDRMTSRFAEFGTNRGVAKEAKDGLDTGQQLCYVAFDILYDGDSSVIHRPLRERQQLLQKAICPLTGRVEILIPEAGGLNSKRARGEPRWSILATGPEDVEQFFQETIDNREEGVVLKDFDSKWEPSDRSGKWLKLKPDYIHTESDLDVLIIGGYYGSGRRGGEVAQFLLGVAERPLTGGYPTKFHSFCKVGTGLTDDESEHLVRKLKPYFRRNEKGSKPPSFYVVTDSSKERPDVWIHQPEKSVILQITSDIRTIRSEIFAAPYSLRFPRVQKVRYDKPWYDCLDVQALVEAVNLKTGNVAEAGEDRGVLPRDRAKRAKQGKPESQRLSLVPSHMLGTNVSNIKQSTHIFKSFVFYFVNTSNDYPIEKLHKLVVENGGTFSMNLNTVVTHVVACEKKGLKFQAALKNGDVIHISWLLDSVSQKSLLPLGPKYYLHMSDVTKEKMKAEVDEFGDFYFIDVDGSDVRQLFANMDTSNQELDIEKVKHYTKKYCPTPTWCHFCGCSVYFLRFLHTINEDILEVAALTLKRLALEVGMHEGTVCDKLTREVTHIVVYIDQGTPVPFQTILQSVCPEERSRLLSKRVKVVSHHWIEDALSSKSCRHPAEGGYDLRGGITSESDEEEEHLETSSAHTEIARPGPSTPSKRVGSRPPRKPIPVKQVVSRVGRARGRRGTQVVSSQTAGPSTPAEEEIIDKKKMVKSGSWAKKTQEDMACKGEVIAEHSLLGEAENVGMKRALRSGRTRKTQESSSDSDDMVPKRRLSLEEDSEEHRKQDLKSASMAMKVLRAQPNRTVQKRKTQNSDEDQGPVACTVQDQQQEKRIKEDHPSLREEVNQNKSLQLHELAQSSVDAMLGDLLPSYFASQRIDLNIEGNAASILQTASTHLSDTFDAENSERRADIGSLEGTPQVPLAVNAAPDIDLSRVSTTQEAVTEQPSTADSPSKLLEQKKRVSYKDLVNRMLDFD